MTIAVCPGSFDPFTLGHLDVVRRAAALFDQVWVAVAVNPGKLGLLDVATRVSVTEAALAEDAGLGGVRVAAVPGLLVDFCRQVGATAIVKGLRGAADLAAETPMSLMNRHLSGVETVFVQGDPALAHIASSLAKDVARHGGPIEDLVPTGAAKAIRSALDAKEN